MRAARGAEPSEKLGAQAQRRSGLPRSFKYDLAKIYPEADSGSVVMLQETFSVDAGKFDQLDKRFSVLNIHGVFFYESKTHFDQIPDKPLTVVPRQEIDRIDFYEVPARLTLMKRAALKASDKRQRLVFVISIHLRRNYREIVKLIRNSGNEIRHKPVPRK